MMGFVTWHSGSCRQNLDQLWICRTSGSPSETSWVAPLLGFLGGLSIKLTPGYLRLLNWQPKSGGRRGGRGGTRELVFLMRLGWGLRAPVFG